jgi:DNA invertase Pin-like site-specific DNA recombinase
LAPPPAGVAPYAANRRQRQRSAWRRNRLLAPTPGRPAELHADPLDEFKVAERIRAALAGGMSVRKTAAKFEVNPSTVRVVPVVGDL